MEEGILEHPTMYHYSRHEPAAVNVLTSDVLALNIIGHVSEHWYSRSLGWLQDLWSTNQISTILQGWFSSCS